MLVGCLVQLLSACKPGLTSGEDFPAEMPGASGAKAISNSEEVTCSIVTSSKLSCLDVELDVTCCSQLLPSRAERMTINCQARVKVRWRLLGPAAYYL